MNKRNDIKIIKYIIEYFSKVNNIIDLIILYLSNIFDPTLPSILYKINLIKYIELDFNKIKRIKYYCGKYIKYKNINVNIDIFINNIINN